MAATVDLEEKESQLTISIGKKKIYFKCESKMQSPPKRGRMCDLLITLDTVPKLRWALPEFE